MPILKAKLIKPLTLQFRIKNMEDITPQMPLSHDWNKERLETLKTMFPDLFTSEGSLNADELKKLVDPQSINETERYEFRWFGKSQAKRNAFTPSNATLVFDEQRSVNPNKAENLIIEGENLEVLKLLSSAYREQIKCIYIDPPYNKDKDYVYKDTWKQDVKGYWEDVGITEEGIRIDTNSVADGSYHSNWLNMIYSRLLVARQLLKEEGVVFISIDETEVHNLRKMGEEVFGVDNYAGEIIWKNSSKNDQDYISIQHEYILCFVKSKEENKGIWTEKKEGLEAIYKAFDEFRRNYGSDWKKIHKEALEWYKQFPESNPIYSSKHYSWMDEEGVYFAADISGPNFGQYRYDVIHPVTGKVCKEPASGWRYPEVTIKERIKQNLVHFGDDETTVPNNKTYLKNTETQSLTSVKYKDGRVASKKLTQLLGGNFFTNPKDADLLSQFFKSVGVADDDIVLDFFSGSGSTGEALAILNNEDGKNRKFILVQIPEQLDDKTDVGKNAIGAGYKKISDITIQRSKLVVEKILADRKSQQLEMFKEGESDKGLGFKVFKLTKSKFPRVDWTPDPDKTDAENIDAFKKYVAEKEAQLVTLFNREELITEILLKKGFNLNYKTAKQSQFDANDVFLATDGNKEALICLDAPLSDKTVEYLKTHTGKIFICLERALDTTKKWNLKHYLGDKLQAF